MSRTGRFSTSWEESFPRVSGDEPLKHDTHIDHAWFSPRERG